MERYYIAKGMLATETGVLEQFPLGIPEFLIEVCKAADAQQRITDLEQQVQALNKERDEYMSKEGPSDGFWGRNCARLLEREKLAQAALRRAKAEVWQPFETAPKEWNEILVVYTKCKPRVYELVYFNTVHKYWMCKGEPRLNLERSECYWMPISNFDDARAAQIEEGA